MIGCVLLTIGDRPSELARAVASVRSQRDVDVDVVVVFNGADPPTEVPGARIVHLPVNAGIPGGRNIGLDAVAGELVLFLDDDAELAAPDVLQRAQGMFLDDHSLGIISMRIVDPSGRPAQRRHVPRLRVGDPSESSEATTFLGGASLVRRQVFEDVGRFPDSFFYAHEELDLAWRAIDAGWRVWYAADLVVHHPAVSPSRHGRYHELTMRNRVLLVRRRLPWLVAVLHLLVWIAISVLRGSFTKDSLRGLVAGVRTRGVVRRPMSWRTVLRLTRLGRPPIV